MIISSRPHRHRPGLFRGLRTLRGTQPAGRSRQRGQRLRPRRPGNPLQQRSHREGLFLENRPEHLLQKLALNALGVCCVPIKPDHLPSKQAYVVDHARLDLIQALTPRTIPGMYDQRSLKKRH